MKILIRRPPMMLETKIWDEWAGSSERCITPHIRFYHYRSTNMLRFSFWKWTLDIGVQILSHDDAGQMAVARKKYDDPKPDVHCYANFCTRKSGPCAKTGRGRHENLDRMR